MSFDICIIFLKNVKNDSEFFIILILLLNICFFNVLWFLSFKKIIILILTTGLSSNSSYRKSIFLIYLTNPCMAEMCFPWLYIWTVARLNINSCSGEYSLLPSKQLLAFIVIKEKSDFCSHIVNLFFTFMWVGVGLFSFLLLVT